MLLSRWKYYLSSIPTLLTGVTNWWNVFWGLLTRRLFIVYLRNGLRFTVRSPMDIWIIKETCLDHDYEVNGVPLQDGWTVVDIGAGLGDFTVYAARKLPNSRVYAYEPYPQSFELLNKNIQENEVKNVVTFPHAVGSELKEANLNIGTTDPVKFSTAISSTISTVKVEVVTLNDLVKMIEVCDFLKLDCEGAEYDILLNAKVETLAKIRRISMEYHDEVVQFSHYDLVKFLRDKGFSVVTRPNPAHNHIGFLYASQVIEE